jgi:hypothetical protein
MVIQDSGLRGIGTIPNEPQFGKCREIEERCAVERTTRDVRQAMEFVEARHRTEGSGRKRGGAPDDKGALFVHMDPY